MDTSNEGLVPPQKPVRCALCGRRFKNAHGYAIHHSHIHRAAPGTTAFTAEGFRLGDTVRIHDREVLGKKRKVGRIVRILPATDNSRAIFKVKLLRPFVVRGVAIPSLHRTAKFLHHTSSRASQV